MVFPISNCLTNASGLTQQQLIDPGMLEDDARLEFVEMLEHGMPQPLTGLRGPLVCHTVDKLYARPIFSLNVPQRS